MLHSCEGRLHQWTGCLMEMAWLAIKMADMRIKMKRLIFMMDYVYNIALVVFEELGQQEMGQKIVQVLYRRNQNPEFSSIINKQQIGRTMKYNMMSNSTTKFRTRQHSILHGRSRRLLCSNSEFNHWKENIVPNFGKSGTSPQNKKSQLILYGEGSSKLGLSRKKSKRSQLKQFAEKQNNVLEQQPIIKISQVMLSNYVLSHHSLSVNRRYIFNLYRGAKFAIQKLKPLPLQYIQHRSVYLSQPTNCKDKFLFLDLDQTLIATEKQTATVTNNRTTFKLSIRPYAHYFLEQLSPYYQIYIFTAAVKSYAEAAIKKLNKNGIYIKDFLSRQNCVQTRKGKSIKDLRIIKNRQLKDIVILDNMVQSFGLQLDNGIPILDFDGYTHDDELLRLIPFLQELSKADDVRPKIRERYQLQRILGLDRKELEGYLGRQAP